MRLLRFTAALALLAGVATADETTFTARLKIGGAT